VEGSKHNLDQLILGTAQLGMPYGIANKTGRPNQKNATQIIETAWSSGIKTFDTAQGYGNSEEVLGRAFHDLSISGDLKVISKLHPKLNHQNRDELVRSLENSLTLMGVSQLYGLLLHSEELLALWEGSLVEFAESAIKKRLVKKFGVSVYSPEAALQATEIPGIGIIQLPTNILDRRFVDAGVFELAKKKGIEVHIRSAFLQGLILLQVDEIPASLKKVTGALSHLDELCKGYSITRQQLALTYLKQEFPEAKLVFGAETAKQVTGNIDCWQKKNIVIPPEAWKQLEGLDQEILNPSLWKL
jgi:aryl-alcohol dehydrogenase-like predicted oxidoreductase